MLVNLKVAITIILCFNKYRNLVKLLAAQQRITEETKGCSLLEHTRTTTACLGHSAL
eukprot:COSAG06_NODE_28309_length_576_cov_8.064990_2_plen_56_part_01